MASQNMTSKPAIF